LQIPHFDEEAIKHCHRGKNAVSTLTDFITKEETRKGLKGMEAQQLLDVEAFAQHVSDMELVATIEVEDEKEIVVGDIATITARLTRRNLKEKEAMGPVHAPLFPEPKFEEWWIFLVEAPSTRIIAFERIRDTERVVEEKLRFQVSRPGKHQLVLHALCDSYSGLDQKAELNFNASTEEEVKRDIFIHPEDEDLDLQPTLFQQFMGDMGKDEESDEEEEEGEGGDKKKPKPAANARRGQAKDLGKPLEAGKEGDDSDSDDAKKGDKDGSDSDSSSDSDEE
jgi:translocation protein SEC63